MSSSSTLTTHPKTMDQISIKGADVMIMTALTHTPTQVRGRKYYLLSST